MTAKDVQTILNHMSREQIGQVSRHAHRLLNPPFPLLRLPPELRNTIYSEVIQHHLTNVK